MTYLVEIFAILGGLLCLYESVVALRRLVREWRRFSWDAILRATDKLHENITAKKFDPDMIVGLGRGGAIAAGLLAARFRQDPKGSGRVIPISAVDRVYLSKPNGGRKDVVIVGIHHLDVYGKNALILNADTYSGATLEKALLALSPDEPKTLKTASLFVYMREGKNPAYAPDFVGEFVPVRKVNKRLPWRQGKYPLEDEVDFRDKHAVLIVLHGLVATGKTSVANAIAKGLRYTPVYSDWYWYKHGLLARDKDPAVSVKHNNHMLDLCWSVIAGDNHAILDCTTRWFSFRRDIRTSFAARGVTVIFVRCSCSEQSALDRIQRRTFLGPHDFGTKSEYERVKKDYNPIEQDEARQLCLIDVDTDALSCVLVNSTVQDRDNEILADIRHAIEQYYLAPLKQEVRKRG